MAAMNPFEVAPLGYSRPWYPIFTGKCEIQSEAVDGDHLNVSLSVGPMVKRRVGLRRWLRRRGSSSLPS